MSDTPSTVIPDWAKELITLYESDANSQFILHGNVNDRLLMPDGRMGRRKETGSLTEFLVDVLLEPFDVVITYDLGAGIRIEKGGQIFSR